MSHLFGFKSDIVHPHAMIAGTGLRTGRINTHRQGFHLGTHNLHYGTGAFEGMQAAEGVDGQRRIMFPHEHATRLRQSGEQIGIITESSGPAVDTIFELLRGTTRANWDRRDQRWPLYLRPLLVEGSCQLGVGSSDGWILTVISRDKTPYLGDSVRTGVTIWAPGPDHFCRGDDRTGFPTAKWVGNYPLGYKFKKRAATFGAVEVLQFDLQGYLAETTGSNIFIVVKERVYTPRLGCILNGITRRRVIAILQALGYEVIETDISPDLLAQADEVFLTGTWSGVVPVRVILTGMTHLEPLMAPFHDRDPGRITLLAQRVYNSITNYDLDQLPNNLEISQDWWLEV